MSETSEKPLKKTISLVRKLSYLAVSIIIAYAIGYFIMGSMVSEKNMQALLDSIRNSKVYFMLIRIAIYVCIYYSWPKLIERKLQGRKLSDEEMEAAIGYRNRVVAWFVVIEVIF